MTEKNFVLKQIEFYESGNLKIFPTDFLKSEKCKELQLPCKTLVLGPELFGAYELLDVDKVTQIQASNITEAKYILYANRAKPKKIKIPVDESEVLKVVKEYEKYLDSIVRKIVEDYKSIFPNSNKSMEIANQIFSSLKLKRY